MGGRRVGNDPSLPRYHPTQAAVLQPLTMNCLLARGLGEGGEGAVGGGEIERMGGEGGGMTAEMALRRNVAWVQKETLN